MDIQTIIPSQWSTITRPPCAVILAALACLPAESALQLYGFNWAGGPQWPQVDATAEARAVGGLQTAGLLRVHPSPCQGAPSLPYRAETPSRHNGPAPATASHPPFVAPRAASAGGRPMLCPAPRSAAERTPPAASRRRIGSPPDTRARKLAIGYGDALRALGGVPLACDDTFIRSHLQAGSRMPTNIAASPQGCGHACGSWTSTAGRLAASAGWRRRPTCATRSTRSARSCTAAAWRPPQVPPFAMLFHAGSCAVSVSPPHKAPTACRYFRARCVELHWQGSAHAPVQAGRYRQAEFPPPPSNFHRRRRGGGGKGAGGRGGAARRAAAPVPPAALRRRTARGACRQQQAHGRGAARRPRRGHHRALRRHRPQVPRTSMQTTLRLTLRLAEQRCPRRGHRRALRRRGPQASKRPALECRIGCASLHHKPRERIGAERRAARHADTDQRALRRREPQARVSRGKELEGSAAPSSHSRLAWLDFSLPCVAAGCSASGAWCGWPPSGRGCRGRRPAAATRDWTLRCRRLWTAPSGAPSR